MHCLLSTICCIQGLVEFSQKTFSIGILQCNIPHLANDALLSSIYWLHALWVAVGEV